MNAFLVQHLEHGVRVTSTPMMARREVLRERRPMTHQGQPGLLLAGADGSIVAWISEAEWRQVPTVPPVQRRPADRTRAASANGHRPKLRLNHGGQRPAPKEPKRRDRANAWYERMAGWLGDIVDPVPPIFSTVTKGTPLKPLAIGLHHDLYPLLRPDVRPKRLKDWLTGWCGSISYVEALARPGSMRHGLGGQPVGPVLGADRAKALEMLPGLRQALKEKREADKEAADPLTGMCADCLEPRPDLEAGICAGCRAAAQAAVGVGVHPHPVEHVVAHTEARRAARQASDRRFVGRPCPTHGAGVERYTSNGRCVTCASESARRGKSNGSFLERSIESAIDMVENPYGCPALQDLAAEFLNDHSAPGGRKQRRSR